MPKFNKNIVALLFFSSSMIMALLFINMNLPISLSEPSEPIYLHGPPLTPIHMHSNESLVPVHMNSNMTLTPVHMHYVGDSAIDPIYEPIYTPWHELYPEFCPKWHLTSWKDYNGDEILSPNDQIDMTDEDGNVTWYHVDRITWTLNLTDMSGEERMFIEFKGPPDAEPIYSPVCTYWHEVHPSYSNVYHIVNWIDNGNGYLDFCDFIDVEDINTGVITSWHVEDVATDLILREKIMDPICTWWHEIYPDYCKWWHITSWEDNQPEGDPGYGMLSPCDQIDMTNYASEEEMWNVFWSMGDVNRDGYINQTDLDRIAAKFGWEGPPGGIPEDINSDGSVNLTDLNICARNQGLIFWTYFYKWYHVDRVTLTLNVSRELEPAEWMKIELKTSYFEEMYNALKHPIETRWHEVYPHYSNVYMLTWWDWFEDDNCNGVLDVCDYIWLLNMTAEVPMEERYHVEDICYDIILNKKIMDPRCTYWHELYPEYCQEWHLTSWEEDFDDPYPGRLSPCDQIDMNNTETGEIKWYHVDRVTLTLYITINATGEPYYFEFKGPFEDMYLVKTKPICTDWTMVWPDYLGEEALHIEDWIDNCNGVLDHCDYILLSGVWCHVEEVAIDIILTEKITDPTCTIWHELYPEYCNEYHIIGWEDNDDRLLSRCDQINMTLLPEGPTKEYHVETVTLTLKVDTMYIEFEIGDAPIEDALVCVTNPINTFWHEIYPEFCSRYEITGWIDNCNGVLDYCDSVQLTAVGALEGIWYHVEEVSYDMVVREKIHDVAVIDKTPFPPGKTVVCQGHSVYFNVTVENQGASTETFNVTLYADTILIGTQKVSGLPPGNQANLTFTWTPTTATPKGNYTITAVADIVPGEIDTADNTHNDVWVYVSMLGDISGPVTFVPDGKVDMIDLWEVSKRYGRDYPDPGYHANCDINSDLKIDMIDIWIVAKEYGKIDP